MGKVPPPTYDVQIEGTVIATRTVQDRGRVQIPPQIRKKLNLSDGDSVFWVEANNQFFIMKAILKIK